MEMIISTTFALDGAKLRPSLWIIGGTDPSPRETVEGLEGGKNVHT